MSRVPARFRGLLTWSLFAASAMLLGACSGAGDFLSKDAEWFNRPSRLFNKSLTLETPPLTEQRPIAPDDLISAEGYCSGMTPASEANAMTQADPGPTGSATAPAGVALGRTECEVARYAGRPDNVEISSEPNGDRLAVLTYLRGARPGIYRFTAGRLASVDRAPVVEAPAKPAKPKKRAT